MREKGRLEKSCDYLSWHFLAGCVLDVFLENQKRDADAPIKSSADTWAIHDKVRKDIFDRACSFYCKRTKLHYTKFPLSVDAVASLYFRFRKRPEDEVSGFIREVECASALDSPSDGKTFFD